MNIHRFYFSGILVGPYLDFFEYMELITEHMFQHAHVKKATQDLLPTPRWLWASSTSVLLSCLVENTTIRFPSRTDAFAETVRWVLS